MGRCLFDVGHLDLATISRFKLERAQHVVHQQQRLAQHAVPWVRVERGGARLSVGEHGGNRGAEVAVFARVGAAAVSTGAEGGRHHAYVAGRRVGGSEALDEAVRYKGRRVGVAEEVVEYRLGLRRRVRRGGRRERHEVRRVAKRTATATPQRSSDVHRRESVGEARAACLEEEHGLCIEASASAFASASASACFVHIHLRAAREQCVRAGWILGRAQVTDVARLLHLRGGDGGHVERGVDRDDHIAQACAATHGAAFFGTGVDLGVGASVPGDAEVMLVVDVERGPACLCTAVRVVHDAHLAVNKRVSRTTPRRMPRGLAYLRTWPRRSTCTRRLHDALVQ